MRATETTAHAPPANAAASTTTARNRRKKTDPRAGAVLVLTGRFLDDYLEMIDRWSKWAAEIVADWPDEPRNAKPDIAALAATVRQAKARAARWRPPDANDAGTDAVSMPAP